MVHWRFVTSDTVARTPPRGVALLMVLMLIAVASILGLSYLYSATIKTAGAANLLKTKRAQHLAASGIDHGRYILDAYGESAEDSTWGPFTVGDNEGTYTISISEDAAINNLYHIQSTATVGGIERSFTVSVTYKESLYRQAVLSLNPVAYYRLGEKSGITAYDETGNHHGSYSGTTLGQSGALQEDDDTSAYFDKDRFHDRVELGNWNVNGSGLTMMAWIYVHNADPEGSRIISKSQGHEVSDHTWMINVWPDGDLRIRVSAGGHTTDEQTGSGEVPLGRWCFVAATYDGTTTSAYVNGNRIFSRSHDVGGPVDTDSREIWIGMNPVTCDRWFDGLIDEVAVFDKALSSEQIRNLYEIGANTGEED